MRSKESSRTDAPSGLAFIGTLREPAALLSEDLFFESANREFLDLLRFEDEEELLNRPFESVCGGTKGLPAILGAEGWVRGIESEFTARDGKKVFVAFSVTKPPHTFSSYMVVARDLSENKRLASELVAARERLLKREQYLEDFRGGVFMMLKDLDNNETELKEAYRKLESTHLQLIQSSKMTLLGEISAGLAHELNQPLTVIKGLSQSIMKGMDGASPLYDRIKLITDASRKMEAIIKHLNVFSRQEPPALLPVDLNSVIKDAFLMVSEMLLTHSIETVMDLEEVPAVLGSANRLEQVVINLITNAKDAMPGGGVLEISTRAVGQGSRRFSRIAIRDSGAGIPQEIASRIFDPFFTTKKAGKGTGLGLSICCGIIEEHNGRITVESGPGKGAVFHITLPALA